jgi:cytochrome c oxidase subunit IV
VSVVVEEPPVSTVDHSAVEHPEPVEPAVDYDSAHEAEHPRDLLYIKVALALFVLTGMEVSASYADWLGDAFLPLLLILMAVKFVLVVLFFMHLKFDAKIFGRLFWAGFFLAVAVYCTALATFHFFAS